MSEPTNTLYPSATDDATSLLGALQNREVYLVAAAVAVDDLQIALNADLSGVALPCYFVFEGGEIVFADAIGGSGNSKILLGSLAQRGCRGSPVQPHGTGEYVYIGLVAPHQIQMKKAILAAERHQGFVGSDAGKPASPQPGWRYTCLDTGKVYYCFVDNVWTRIDYTDHGQLAGLTDDDHSQYQTDARATTWHGVQSGEHIAGGDDHNHFGAGEGLPFVQVISGLEANRPLTPVPGQVYFSVNLDGGTLFVAVDSGWAKISGVPTGGIMPFDGACPSGWTRETALDNKYPMGGLPGDQGVAGGSTTHTHLYDEIEPHYHLIPSVNATSSDAGSHDHTINKGSGAAGSSYASSGQSNLWDGTSSNGDHNHSTPVAEHYTQYAGVVGAATDAASSLPSSREIVFCRKD